MESARWLQTPSRAHRLYKTMLLKSSLLPRGGALVPPEKGHSKRPRIMNTPPDDELPSVSRRFPGPEPDTIAENGAPVTASWTRLLCQLRQEIQAVADAGSRTIPTINFEDLRYGNPLEKSCPRMRISEPMHADSKTPRLHPATPREPARSSTACREKAPPSSAASSRPATPRHGPAPWTSTSPTTDNPHRQRRRSRRPGARLTTSTTQRRRPGRRRSRTTSSGAPLSSAPGRTPTPSPRSASS